MFAGGGGAAYRTGSNILEEPIGSPAAGQRRPGSALRLQDLQGDPQVATCRSIEDAMETSLCALTPPNTEYPDEWCSLGPIYLSPARCRWTR